MTPAKENGPQMYCKQNLGEPLVDAYGAFFQDQKFQHIVGLWDCDKVEGEPLGR